MQFQFHNGTIKTWPRYTRKNFAKGRFNSITVQLRHTTEVHIIYLTLFQFHNGTIKTKVFQEHLPLDKKFQFHNGTIKTYSSIQSVQQSSWFQFHNGTIKTHFRIFEDEIFQKFQFHNGTIKTREDFENEILWWNVSIP